mgnify:FL=1
MGVTAGFRGHHAQDVTCEILGPRRADHAALEGLLSDSHMTGGPVMTQCVHSSSEHVCEQP